MKHSSKNPAWLARLLTGGAAVVALYLACIATGRRESGSDTTPQAKAPVSAKPAAAPVVSPNGSHGPVLSILNADLQLDDLQSGKSQEVEVAMRNDGTAPLILDSVSLDSGCEITRLPDKEIHPGESAAIGVRITSSSHHSGSIRILKLHSNATGEPGTITVRSTPAARVNAGPAAQASQNL